MMTSEELRLLLLGDASDTSADPLIAALRKLAETRFLFLINSIQQEAGIISTPAIPDPLKWIIDEVIIRRFNRLGSEGYQSQSVGGHSITFSADDFQDFMMDIRSYLVPNQRVRSGRVVMF